MTTLRAVFLDLATDLGEAGFKWVFVLTMHGAPTHNQALDQAAQYFSETYGGRMVHVTGLTSVVGAVPPDLFTVEQRAAEGFSIHADADEHSCLLFLRPDLVAPGIRSAPAVVSRDFAELVATAQKSRGGQATSALRQSPRPKPGVAPCTPSLRRLSTSSRTCSTAAATRGRAWRIGRTADPAFRGVMEVGLEHEQQIERKQAEWLRSSDRDRRDMAMTLKETLAQLKALGDEKGRAHNRKNGAGDNQFGVELGDIRKLAAKIKTGHSLAIELWDTGIIDARLLAILLMKPNDLSRDEMDRMVRSVEFAQVADWLNSYVVKNHRDKEILRQTWMEDEDPWAARAGWSLTSERIAKNPDGLDLPALLDRIESEMGKAAPEVQWTMNFCLAGIGIHFSKHRKRAMAIGETLGVYRNYPVSKGCTSPFAPIWIREMVRRQS